MANSLRTCLMGQFDMAWKLAGYHLDGLTTEECLWRPAARGPHIHHAVDGSWRAEWPEHEGYDLGPPSIGWLTWHMGFWWSMVLDHSFGAVQLTRQEIIWPGSADSARRWITLLHDQWRAAIEPLSDADLESPGRTRWPFQNRPFGDVVAWVNIELTKNAAEVGYARFLHRVRARSAQA